MTPDAYQICFFQSKHDRKPQPRSYDWQGICNLLTTHRERDKKDGVLFSPVTYRPSETRGLTGVETVCALVLDLDAQRPDAKLFEGFAYIAYTTYSHTQETPKWRVFLPLAAPIPAEEWPDLWRRMVHVIAPYTDPACSDSSRMFYLPSCPKGSPRKAFVQDGEPLDPYAFPALPAEPLPTRPKYEGTHEGLPGDDFDARIAWDDILIPYGAERVGRWAGCDLWRRPNKDDKGPSFRTGPSQHGDRFLSWSSSSPFPIRHLLKKWQVLAYIGFGGDFNACAKWLYSQGFGDRATTRQRQGSGAR